MAMWLVFLMSLVNFVQSFRLRDAANLSEAASALVGGRSVQENGARFVHDLSGTYNTDPPSAKMYLQKSKPSSDQCFVVRLSSAHYQTDACFGCWPPNYGTFKLYTLSPLFTFVEPGQALLQQNSDKQFTITSAYRKDPFDPTSDFASSSTTTYDKTEELTSITFDITCDYQSLFPADS
eukprot:TRINITY_DN1627_c0_g1_i1.p1 TRINITY_DN1627_c0_g1~~TRINITY_DN1627_c0_g1_i1.p1  ORF type:complete len:206 (-),score=19.05 TRINITY_DN1627_c0_g1_i1:26-562(-)